MASRFRTAPPHAEIQRAVDATFRRPADDEGHIAELSSMSAVHKLRGRLSKYDAAAVAETLLLEIVRLRLVAEVRQLRAGAARSAEQLKQMDKLCRSVQSKTEQMRMRAAAQLT